MLTVQAVSETLGGVDNPHLSADLYAFAWADIPGESEAQAIPGGSAMTRNLPVAANGQAITAQRMGSFVYDYYNRIHINPSALALGNLISTQEREVSVWNAYFEPRTLQSLTGTGGEGITVTEPEPAPTEFATLEERTYVFSIDISGPPTIAARYVFAFDVGDVALSVTGARVIPWEWQPNWARPVIERLEWATSVLRAKNGREQRTRLRTHPRRSYEYQMVGTPKERARLEAAVYGWQGRVFALPLWTDPSLVGSLAEGATFVPLETATRDYLDGGLIALRDEQGLEVYEIDSVGSSGITLALPLARSYRRARAYPARLARLQANLAYTRPTRDLLQATVRFAIQGNTAHPPADSPATYCGVPVLEQPPTGSGFGGSYEREMVEADSPLWRDPLFEDRSGVPTTVADYSRVMGDREAIEAMRGWLAARAGRLNPIWVPTWTVDLVALGIITDTALSIDVKHTDYTRHQGRRRDIRIKHRDGRVWYRRITGSLELDADTERLALDAALGAEVDGTDLTISYLTLCTLGADAVELAWHTAGIAQVSVPMRSVVDD